MDSSVQINAPCIKTPSIPQTDFLFPVILHPTPVKQEAPLPPVPEKKSCRLYQDSIT
ncbi:hypothetical protein ABVN80_10020 [Acinetobacter baumannii]